MNEILQRTMMLSGSHLAGLMQDVLDGNACFRFQAGGRSMTPFIRDGDVVTVYPVSARAIGVGDVVAVVDPLPGKVIVHRVVGRVIGRMVEESDRVYVIKGDNCRSVDGWFERSRIVGVIGCVERHGRSVWFGGGPEKRLLAFLSRSGMLNRLVLPLLRKIRRRIPV